MQAQTLAVLNSFLVVGLLGIYLKIELLAEQWEAIARFLGKAHAPDLTLFERLGFFYNDIALNVLVVPVAATVLVTLLFRGHRVAASFVASLVLSLFYFVELRAHTEVGQYISGDVLGDLFGWATYNPETIADYVTPASVVKLAAVVGVLAAIAIIARRARLADRQSSRTATGYRWALLIPATGVMGAALLLLPIGYAHRLPDSAFNLSAVGRAYTTLFGAGGTQDTSTLLTSEQVLDASRQMTRTADFDAGHDLIGRERGSDLIVFMMETGPAQALDFANVGRELPGTGPLFDRAIVARQHYTTHPFSSDAMYSILSGLYPQGRRRLLLNVSGSFNGLMSALAPDVPFRRVYLPSLYQIDLDRGMYAAFGADLYVADEQQSDPLRAVAEHRAETLIADLEGRGHAFAPQPREFLRARLSADFQTIERMTADITAAVKAGRRYAVMVFPEIGHAPWLALGAEDTVLARGRALMRLQDSWLKEIADTARTLGRLDRTVIAVTADHGIRTRIEDPALPAGKISDYTFRVPLLIYAPQALAQTVVVTTPTSHIDLAPTLLALFGKTDNVRRMQGVPVWQRRTGDRIFLLGSAYGGADGFTQDGDFYMRQSLSGAVYHASSFSFADADLAVPGDAVIPFVTSALAEGDELQRALVARYLRELR